MSQNIFTGLATPAVQQVITLSISGTVTIGDTFSFQLKDELNNALTVTSAAATAGTAANASALLRAALAASNDPRFKAVTWSDNLAGVVTGTAKTGGVPIHDGNFTTSGTATIAKATPTPNFGPNDLAVVQNWSLLALPANGDDVVFPSYVAGTGILYGLQALSAIHPASIRHYSGFKQIGTQIAPLVLGYCLDQQWGIGGTGGSFSNIDAGSNGSAASITINGGGAAVGGLDGFLWKGVYAAGAMIVNGGASIGIGRAAPGQAVTLASLEVRGGTVNVGTNLTCPSVIVATSRANVNFDAVPASCTLTLVDGKTRVDGTVQILAAALNGGTLTLNAQPSNKTIGGGNLTRASTTATISFTGHGLLAGDYINIAGITNDTGWNKSWGPIVVPDANTITFTVPSTLTTPATSTGTMTFRQVDIRTLTGNDVSAKLDSNGKSGKLAVGVATIQKGLEIKTTDGAQLQVAVWTAPDPTNGLTLKITPSDT